MFARQRILFSLGTLVLVAALASACGAPSAPAAATEPPAAPAATEAVAPTAEATEATAATPETAQAEAAAPDGAAGLRTFVIVPEQSSASYIVDEEFFADALSKLGISVGRGDTVGVTPAVDGQIQLDLGNLAAPLGENRFHADLSQLKSNQDRRDEWIRTNGPKFADNPDAEFVATSIEGAPSSYTEGEEVTFRLLGDLTVNGTAQPVAFDVTAKLEGGALTGSATGTARMSDFGIEPPEFANTLTVQDEFTMRVDFTAQEQ